MRVVSAPGPGRRGQGQHGQRQQRQPGRQRRIPGGELQLDRHEEDQPGQGAVQEQAGHVGGIGGHAALLDPQEGGEGDQADQPSRGRPVGAAAHLTNWAEAYRGGTAPAWRG